MKRRNGSKRMLLLIVAAILCVSCASAGAETYTTIKKSYNAIDETQDFLHATATDTIKIRLNSKKEIVGVVECTQEKKDYAPVLTLEPGGIAPYYECAGYVLVESKWSVKTGFNVDLPVIKALVDKFAIKWTDGSWYYKITSDGALTCSRTKIEPSASGEGGGFSGGGGSFGGGGGGGRLGEPGDVNGDGSVNDFDVIRLLKYVSGWDVAIVEANSDVNGDKSVNDFDVIRLLKYVSGWDVRLI